MSFCVPVSWNCTFMDLKLRMSHKYMRFIVEALDEKLATECFIINFLL